MERQAFGAVLISLLASCAAPGSPAAPPGDPQGEPQVTTELDIPSLKPREGDLATLNFRIRNATKKYIILRDLNLTKTDTVSMTWQGSQPGLLEYRPGIDEWTYERGKKAGTRRPIFNSGLLLPGEELRVPLRIRLLEMPLEFRLTCFSLTRQEIAQKVYFEVRKDRDVRYRLLAGSDLDERLLKPISRTTAAGHRAVVFPYAEQVVSTALAKTVVVHASLAPRSFTLAEACRKTGQERPPGPDGWTFSTTLDGWVIRNGEETRLVTAASVAPLPRIRQLERTFYYLDVQENAGPLEVEMARESIAAAFQEKRYSLLTHPREGRTRYFVFVRKPDLQRLFSDVRELKLALDVEMLPDGGGRLVVTK